MSMGMGMGREGRGLGCREGRDVRMCPSLQLMSLVCCVLGDPG